MTEIAAEGPVSARMQALLSRAVEEQVSEQRQAAGALSELRSTVGQLQDALRGAATNDTVERLESQVSTVVADLRTSTTLLSQRLESLAQRVESIVADTTAPLEQSTVRLGALAAEVTAQAEAVDRMRQALDLMGSFPQSLAALQGDVAGLHDRLAPLGDIQSAVADLGARTAATLHALLPQLQSLEEKVAAIGAVPGPERLRDAVVDGLAVRLDRLQQAGERPVVGPEVLRSGLGDLRASLVATVGEAAEPLTTGLLSLESRLDQLESRLGTLDVLLATGRESAAGLAGLRDRLDEVGTLRAQLDALSAGLMALRAEGGTGQVNAALESLSSEIAELGAELAQPPALPVEDLSNQVSVRVADRLVEVLAPRISDVVLTRVSAALVTQLGEAVGPRLRAETEGVLRALNAESEKRVLAHVDEAMLALAEALLRRKAVRRPAASTEAVAAEVPAAVPPAAPAAEPAQPEESVQEVLDRLAADEPLVEELAAHEPLVAEPAASAPPAAEPATSAVLDAIGEAEFPEIQSASDAAAPAAPPAPAPAAQAVARPAVTSGLAPVPTASATVAAPAPVPVAPAARPAEAKQKPPRKAAAKKAPAKRPAKKAAPARGTGPAVTPVKKAAPVKAARPRPRPFLEPTPDLEDHDVTPVRHSGPGAPMRTPAAPAPLPPSAFAAPGVQPPPAPPAAVRPAEPRKRKPWWRPGG